TVRFSPDDLQREQQVRQDGFDLMLRRQGWYLIQHRPVYTDARVIHLSRNGQEESGQDPLTAFYEAFGETTFRKLLRHIIFHQQGTLNELRGMCSGEQKLTKYLDFMQRYRLIVLAGENWRKGPEYRAINNIGSSLEWYIAEWFRRWLQVPARHGVTIKGVADGGDLDVVAFVDGIRVMIECKSGSPTQISETDVRLFFQRAADFNPEIAVLLIDTESRIDQQIEIFNRLRSGGDPLKPQDPGKTLYWGARHIYVTNTKPGIGEALSAILRLYYSKIRHISFWR
ncbi:MAG TPA: hypothetical protein VFV38_15295, partial [Ktedonobacteraceae bacterium]|nr:hypothetical protein [Ktedonobacteraceae bacterium]